MSALDELGIVLRRASPGEHRAPCPQCAALKSRKRDDALAVRIEPDGAAIWVCHRCGWRGVMGAKGREATSHAGLVRTEPERPTGDLDAALMLWRSARPITPGTVAASYLQARGCALPHLDGDLRFLERHRHPSGHVGPALVALVTDAISVRPMTLHRTWIRPDGTKAAIDKPRLLWPGLPKLGGVVRLWPDDAVIDGLCIAEGIENALVAARGFGLAWACLDAGNLAELPFLDGVGALTIVADHDPAGLAAAQACAVRWYGAGVEVRMWTAPNTGADFNDYALEAP